MAETLLPPNASEYERALEGASARISDVPVLVRESWDPDACPSALLPWLASAFSVDAWNAKWTDEQKRQAIKDSVYVHRHKGTIGAVLRSLSAIGFSVQVQEWFKQLPLGEPYTFRLLLTADQVGYSQEDIARIVSLVEATKNLRSHLTEIVPAVVTTAGPMVAAATNIGNEITVKFGDTAGFYLLQEGARNGFPQTEAAVDQLHETLNETLANPAYW